MNSIPRLKGQFLWSQIVANKKAGADMLYIAMFDEVDEATEKSIADAIGEFVLQYAQEKKEQASVQPHANEEVIEQETQETATV